MSDQAMTETEDTEAQLLQRRLATLKPMGKFSIAIFDEFGPDCFSPTRFCLLDHEGNYVASNNPDKIIETIKQKLIPARPTAHPEPVETT